MNQLFVVQSQSCVHLQTQLPCPSPSPQGYLNSCLLSRWYHPNISSSVAPFSFCPLSFPASRSFQMNKLFASGGLNIRVSASASVLLPTKVHLVRAMVFPVVMYGCELDYKESWVAKNRCLWTVVLKKTLESPLDCKEIQSIYPKGNQSKYPSEGPMLKLKLQYFGHLMWIFRAGFPLGLTGLISLLSRFIIAFLPRNKHILIYWLQSPSTVILEPKKRKSVTVSIFSPSICHEVMGPDAMILVFWMLSFKPAFHSRLSPSSKVF